MQGGILARICAATAALVVLILCVRRYHVSHAPRRPRFARQDTRHRAEKRRRKKPRIPPVRCETLPDVPCRPDPAGRRIIDVVLYSSSADADMRTIRLGETAGCVNATVFAETAFEFQLGRPKAVSPAADFVIPRNESALAYCSRYTTSNASSHRRPPGKHVWRTWASFCRETYARLWLHTVHRAAPNPGTPSRSEYLS